MTKPTIPRSRASDAVYLSGLINRPWERGALHCWRLVVDVQRDLFGRDVPAVLDVVPQGRDGMVLAQHLFAEHPERARWREVIAPQDGAIVLMHKPLNDHAGVYLELDGGGVLHCDEPQGVAFETVIQLRDLRRWSRIQFFVPRD